MISIDLIPLNIAIYRYENGAFIFSELNLHALKTENIKQEDIIGKKLTDVFPGIQEFGLLEVLERVIKTGVSEHFKASYYHDDLREG